MNKLLIFIIAVCLVKIVWLWFRISALQEKIEDHESDMLNLKSSHQANLKEAYNEGLKDGSPIVMTRDDK